MHTAINRFVVLPLPKNDSGAHRLQTYRLYLKLERADHSITGLELQEPVILHGARYNMSNPPRHIVYLSCREIFTNAHTHIRQLRAILGQLECCKYLLQPLLAKYKLDAIAAVAKHLLEDKVFESPLRAREVFPALFAGADAERKAIEAETTNSETAAVKLAAIEDEIEDESKSNAIKKPNTAEDNHKTKNPKNYEYHG